jgi:hypothetical protein
MKTMIEPVEKEDSAAGGAGIWSLPVLVCDRGAYLTTVMWQKL